VGGAAVGALVRLLAPDPPARGAQPGFRQERTAAAQVVERHAIAYRLTPIGVASARVSELDGLIFEVLYGRREVDDGPEPGGLA
jgi:hypothetical protein